MPPNTIYVGRPSIFGNPFTIKEFGNIGTVIKYQRWLENTLDGMKVRDKAREELKGKNLACFCPPGGFEGLATCHADILLELANKE